MEVTCPACAARYTADDERIRGKTARMRCRSCDTVWLVGGEEEEISSDKRAAVLRRGADREKADLFAPRPSDHGMVSPTMPPPRADGVAARNESSVLFTVDSLRGSARVKTPEPAPSPISVRPPPPADDDEGIIDLNALKSMPPRTAARPVAPLFSEPPPAFARDVGASYPPTEARRFPTKVKTAGMIAAAAVAVIVGIFGIAHAFKGDEPVARVAEPPPPPAAAAEPPPAATADPAPSASATPDDPKPVASGKKGHRHFAKSAPASFKKGQSDAPAAFKPPPPVKAADPCGCHGDFNCILRCTAKGK
jgi:predicted Zn finger-like uncharacterized protein